MITTTFSDYILNKIFAQATSTVTWPNVCYLGLSTEEPGADGSNFTEFATIIPESDNQSTGYERIDITSHMSTASNQSITNTKEIHFLEAQIEWGRANYFGVFSAKTGGKPIFWGAINQEEDGTVTGALIEANNVAIIPAGQLTVTLQ